MLPGLGTADPRVAVDVAAAPWSAIVLIQVAGVARCTGFLLDDRTAMTAAHCLYSPRVRHLVRADSVHVLNGYERGHLVGHTVAEAFRVADGWNMLDEGETRGADAAVLTLRASLGVGNLRLAPGSAGTQAMLGGYEQDRAQILIADRDCRVLGESVDPQGRALLRHSCSATSGTSGAPLLVRDRSGGWAVAGLQVAGIKGAAGGVAVPGAALAALVGSK